MDVNDMGAEMVDENGVDKVLPYFECLTFHCNGSVMHSLLV